MSIPATLLLLALIALAPTHTLFASTPATEEATTTAATTSPRASLDLSYPALHTPHPTLPPADSLDTDTINQPVDPFLQDYLIPALTIVIAVPIHELGHFVIAKSVGAKSVEIVFFPDTRGGIPAIAANIIDTEGLTALDLGLISIAGVGVTRLMAEVNDQIARGFDNRMLNPTFAQMLNSGLFVAGRLDFPLYLMSDLVTNLLQRPGGDIDILVTQIAGRATLPRIGAYLGLIVIAGVDFYFDQERIGYHYSILSGNQMQHPSTRSSLRIGMMPGGVGARYSVTF